MKQDGEIEWGINHAIHVLSFTSLLASDCSYLKILFFCNLICAALCLKKRVIRPKWHWQLILKEMVIFLCVSIYWRHIKSTEWKNKRKMSLFLRSNWFAQFTSRDLVTFHTKTGNENISLPPHLISNYRNGYESLIFLRVG